MFYPIKQQNNRDNMNTTNATNSYIDNKIIPRVLNNVSCRSHELKDYDSRHDSYYKETHALNIK